MKETFSAMGTGSDIITFTAYNNPNFYYVDDVSVVETAGPPSVVPEPSSVMLLGAGMLGLLSLKLRKRLRS